VGRTDYPVVCGSQSFLTVAAGQGTPRVLTLTPKLMKGSQKKGKGTSRPCRMDGVSFASYKRKKKSTEGER